MDIKRRLLEVEKIDVKNIKVQKFDRSFEVYPWIKSRIFHKALMGNEVLQGKSLKILWKQLMTLPGGVFSIFRKYDVWAFTSSSERVLLDDQYVDKLMDPLTFNSKVKLLVVELQLFARYKKSQLKSDHLVSRALFVFIEELYILLFLKVPKVEGTKELEQIEEILGEKINVPNIIKKYLAQYRIMKLFLRLLPKPKVIFLTVSYANFGYIRAWKEAGIKVVEMQHGLMGDGHYGYMYHAILDPIQFPDDILVFGDSDADFFSKTKIPIKRSIPIGRFVIDHFHQEAKQNVIPIRSILVSLQDGHLSEALIEFVLKCNELSASKYDWLLQTRRTPASIYEKKYVFPENISFSKMSIYEAIGQTDAHLTIYSTTAVESLSIGKPTFLFDFKGTATTYLEPFLGSNENVYFCNDEHEFEKFISTLKLKSLKEIANSNSSNISPNYTQKIADYMQSILYEDTKK